MALVAYTTRTSNVVGNKRMTVGTATLASGTNHVNTGLRRIMFADVIPTGDAAGTGWSVTALLNTAAGTEGDAPGFLTITSADALAYNIFAYGI